MRRGRGATCATVAEIKVDEILAVEFAALLHAWQTWVISLCRSLAPQSCVVRVWTAFAPEGKTSVWPMSGKTAEQICRATRRAGNIFPARDIGSTKICIYQRNFKENLKTQLTLRPQNHIFRSARHDAGWIDNGYNRRDRSTGPHRR